MRGGSCIRQLGNGDGAQTKAFRRFLANPKVTPERLIASWPQQTGPAVAGRHVLAIQDSSEIDFRTKPERRRGLGEIGKGKGRYGALLHAMLAVDAADGACLGLVGGSVYTRQGRVAVAHGERALEDKESRRWVETARTAKAVLTGAACVTVVADRESDIYAEWATLPGEDFHLLTRVMHDRAVADGGTLASAAAKFGFDTTRTVELLATAKRAPRTAVLSLRFGTVEISRPARPGMKDLAKTVRLTLIEAVERTPPAGVEAIHWRLLTTHDVADAKAAWQIVDWYRQRWIIEQLFRVLKTQGFQIEDSQIASADILLKLIALATKAAAITIQLLQARNGRSDLTVSVAFDSPQIAALAAINARYEAKTKRQKNPFPQRSMAWAAWIIARLGGWDGYSSSRPPGPITFKHGLDQFHAIAIGWALRDVSTP
jgi:hypothetical protein